MLCAALVSCGDADSSTAETTTTTTTATTTAAETTTTTTAAETQPAETEAPAELQVEPIEIDYDPEGDIRLYDGLRDEYYGDYMVSTTQDVDGNIVERTIAVKEDKAYSDTVYGGMKSYTLLPGDGNRYTVYEATTTYQLEENTLYTSDNLDLLFGSTSEFIGAEVDETNAKVTETYHMQPEIVGSEDGEVSFVFSGVDFSLKGFTLKFSEDNISEDNIMIFQVESIGPADEVLVEMPDLSSYTQE